MNNIPLQNQMLGQKLVNLKDATRLLFIFPANQLEILTMKKSENSSKFQAYLNDTGLLDEC